MKNKFLGGIAALAIAAVAAMKKFFLVGIAVLVVAIVAAVNVNLNSQKSVLSDISLANVEALADSEWATPNGGPYYCCGSSYYCRTVSEGDWLPLVYVPGTFRVAPCG